jgi:hypothetical protein
MQEMVPCCVAVSNRPSHLKSALPKKRRDFVRKPNRFHPVQYEKRFCEEPDRLKPDRI